MRKPSHRYSKADAAQSSIGETPRYAISPNSALTPLRALCEQYQIRCIFLPPAEPTLTDHARAASQIATAHGLAADQFLFSEGYATGAFQSDQFHGSKAPGLCPPNLAQHFGPWLAQLHCKVPSYFAEHPMSSRKSNLGTSICRIRRIEHSGLSGGIDSFPSPHACSAGAEFGVY